eukprot:5285904-Prorocentrum_lima.AAC.1
MVKDCPEQRRDERQVTPPSTPQAAVMDVEPVPARGEDLGARRARSRPPLSAPAVMMEMGGLDPGHSSS